MNWALSERTLKFLKENIPDIFLKDDVNEALDMLFDFIAANGFAPPHFDEYNDLGREVQKAYDDIYLHG